TGVTVITAEHDTAGLIGVTANSFNTVSLEPPLILFSLSRRAWSCAPLLGCRGFGINILRDDQRDLSHRFASAGADKWDAVAFRRSARGVPLLDDVLATFECLPHVQHDGGDHVIVVGRVVDFGFDPDGLPLLYFRSHYRAIADEHPVAAP
ncbi:MAG: flavin reductase family protein, partial [Burkholderiales bacterium]|nr:flavin reductase family protein [Burkholderiales bacterium]